jgi:hypothetical protein
MNRLSRSGLREFLSRSPGLQVLLLIVVIVAVLLLAEYTGLFPV